MSSLYNFSKDSNHAKFFKWIWGVDPTKTFNTMCPYFWAYVATILILPIILISKLFGKYGKKFNSFLYNYRKKRRDKILADFLVRAEEITDEEEAYLFVTSRCYDKHYFDLEDETRERLEDLANSYSRKLARENAIKAMEREKKMSKISGNKFIVAIVWAVILASISALIYFVYLLGVYASVNVDWKAVGEALLVMVYIVVAVTSAYFLLFYVIAPLIRKISCTLVPKCKSCGFKPLNYVINFFKAIGRFVRIVIDMIVNTYRKSCPIITWEDN